MPVVITDYIGTSAPSDTYATHYSNLGKGGVHSYALLSERNSITEERRAWGMLCVVYDDGSYNGVYQLKFGKVDTDILNNANWETFTTTSSSPPSSSSAYPSYEIDISSTTTRTLEEILGLASPVSGDFRFYIKTIPTISGKLKFTAQTSPFSNLWLAETFSEYVSGTKDNVGTLNIYFESNTVVFQNRLDPSSTVFLATNLKIVLVQEF